MVFLSLLVSLMGVVVVKAEFAVAIMMVGLCLCWISVLSGTVILAVRCAGLQGGQ